MFHAFASMSGQMHAPNPPDTPEDAVLAPAMLDEMANALPLCRRLNELSGEMTGFDFATGRGWLRPDDQKRFSALKAEMDAGQRSLRTVRGMFRDDLHHAGCCRHMVHCLEVARAHTCDNHERRFDHAFAIDAGHAWEREADHTERTAFFWLLLSIADLWANAFPDLWPPVLAVE